MLNKSFSVNTYNKIKDFKKIISVDSDKSISIRSLLIASISHNISEIHNILESEDVFSTIKCLKKLGIVIKRVKPKNYLVHGKGLGSFFIKKNSVLDCGNSGTLARLLIGILATTPNIETVIKGDKSLNNRNMSKIIELMKLFGADFLPKKRVNFPLKLISSNMPVGIKYEAGVSAQLKSSVMLAALNSYGETHILEKSKSRNHTENILLKNSNVIRVKNNIIKISGKGTLNSINITVPADPSSAAFFVALTLLKENSFLKIKGVMLNPRRVGFYKLLKKSGAKIIFKNIKKKNNEVTGDVLIYSSKLKPIKASAKYYASTTDEYPILFIIAALTEGISEFSGIENLVNKESNRILEMKKILTQVGVKCIHTKNKMKILGLNKNNFNKENIKVKNLGDHRICMSAMILSQLTGIKTQIAGFETVNTSSPTFLKTIKLLGGKFEIKKAS
jgi:3-phosphoshikimate 1-carboxyvinyltransferase